ncbi:MAG: porin [Verrucomicrobiales bacterium]|jgi:hypothetical protein|nr:porin [Verrucomicrobiales bacterium]
MNKWITGLFATALISGSAFADTGAPAPSAKDLSKAVEKVNYVETDVSGVKLSGYVDAGYIYNFTGNNTISTRAAADGQSSGDFNLNTVKLTLSKDLTDKNEWQAGFRADVMLGEDAGSTLGGNDSGNANSFLLEQAYVTFRAPVGNGIDFKVGKFVTWLGYEVIERPSNLNITYGNLFQNMIPLYHTGVSAEYKVNDSISTGLAIVNGYNSDSNNGYDNSGDGYGMEAKIAYTNPGGNFTVQDAVYYSWDSSGEVYGTSSSGPNGNVFINDVVANWTPKFANGKLLLGLNGDFGYADVSQTTTNSDTWFGVAGYAKYQFTDIFSLAGRVDYIHDSDSAAFFSKFQPFTGNADVWSVTLTAGFNLAENLTLRAEYRLDLGDDIQVDGTTGDYASSDVAHSAVFEVVYTF